MAPRFAILVCLSVLLGAAALPAAGADAAVDPLELYRRRDYFELRNALQGASDAPSPARRLLAAAVEHAFNRPEASNRILVELADVADLPTALESERLRLLLDNHLRLHEYGAALEVARQILESPRSHPPALIARVANTARLLEALAGVPPQTIETESAVRLKLALRRRVVAVGVGSARAELGLDTGANFSVLMRSVALRAGLTIRPVGLSVTTSTGLTVEADVAVAERVELGRARFARVVFLIFPDEALSFSDGSRLDGLIGFPVLEQLGEIRFRAGDLFEVPARVPVRKDGNLALDGLELLVRASFAKSDVVCRLDTGSDRTFFYSPFYRHFRERVEGLGARETVEVEGLGGVRRLDAFSVPALTLKVARADLRIRETMVYTQPLVEGEEDRLDCNLGVDLLDRFREYTINFESMALVLGPPRDESRARF